MSETATDDIHRLEALWGGGFGDDYVERNLTSYEARAPFWSALLDRYPCTSALEVGCNVGGNLQWIAPRIGPGAVVGVDVNRHALELLGRRVPGATGLDGVARDLPVATGAFDLVFTMGVLIHQPDESLPAVMDEMVRASRRYVLCGEYYDNHTVEVPYRGHDGALFRRDYGGLFAARHPHLRLVERGFLGRAQGWDDVTWWLFDVTA